MIPVRASRRPLACSVAVTLTVATFVGPVASAGMGDRMLAMINRKREAHGLHDLRASRGCREPFLALAMRGLSAA